MKKLILILTISLTSTICSAEYQYTDSDGVVHTRAQKKGLPRAERELTEGEKLQEQQMQLQAQMQQMQQMQYQQLRMQQYMFIRGMAYQPQINQNGFSQTQQIGNFKYNFSPKGTTIEQQIGGQK